MVEIRRGTMVFVLGTAALAVALVSGPAWSQPPVARPQPPPAAPAAQPPAAAPAATVPVATTSKPPATQPASGQPVGQPTQPAAKPAPSPATAVAPVAPGPASSATTAAAPVPLPPASATSADTRAPTEAELGVPILPGAQYIGSYDAGGAAQRFYLFGTVQSFVDVVAYYRTMLKQKGELVFEVPPTHMFDVGKFKETDIVFPPGVTVKDYVLNGAPGLANPNPGASPAVFPTVIQVVPPPQLPPARPR
jgi:hypothetical protein